MNDRTSTCTNKRSRAGITLVETVLSLVILGGAFVAALNTISSAKAAQATMTQRQLGLVLAEDLMAEILSVGQYQEGATFGPEAGETGATRQAFDDVDDYHGWSASPPVDAAGTTVPGGEGYSRSVTVERVQLSDPSKTSSADERIVRVTVSVKAGQKKVATLTAYRTDAWRSLQEVD